jgi:hypothetical protein
MPLTVKRPWPPSVPARSVYLPAGRSARAVIVAQLPALQARVLALVSPLQIPSDRQEEHRIGIWPVGERLWLPLVGRVPSAGVGEPRDRGVGEGSGRPIAQRADRVTGRPMRRSQSSPGLHLDRLLAPHLSGHPSRPSSTSSANYSRLTRIL